MMSAQRYNVIPSLDGYFGIWDKDAMRLVDIKSDRDEAAGMVRDLEMIDAWEMGR